MLDKKTAFRFEKVTLLIRCLYGLMFIKLILALLTQTQSYLMTSSESVLTILPLIAGYILLFPIFQPQHRLGATYFLYVCLGLYLIFFVYTVMSGFSYNYKTVFDKTNSNSYIENNSIILSGSNIDNFTTLSVLINISLNSCESIDTIKVSGNGGFNASANKIIELATQCGVKTSVAYGKYCGSSCTGIWASFENPEISDNTYMVFHSSSKSDHSDTENWYTPYFGKKFVDHVSRIAHEDGCALSKTSTEELKATDISFEEFLNRCNEHPFTNLSHTE